MCINFLVLNTCRNRVSRTDSTVTVNLHLVGTVCWKYCIDTHIKVQGITEKLLINIFINLVNLAKNGYGG